MDRIAFLKNPILNYAWGSRTAIPDLLGEPTPSDRPAAELWMGAHPKAPSRVWSHGRWRPLPEVLAENPAEVLGRAAARQFANQLPFLFKVLAAEHPLSIQVHPNPDQARQGFDRENRQAVPLDAPQRCYRDPNHKPELLCALEPFEALKGFRDRGEILETLEKLSIPLLEGAYRRLKVHMDTKGLKRFFSDLMGMEKTRRAAVVAEAARQGERYAGTDRAFEWMMKLNRAYPGDVGVLSPLILNLVRLEPGEAIYLPCGELHVYLQGVGMELMANSDNVLRGGLTSKHVDVPELLKVVDFGDGPVHKIKPIRQGPHEQVYGAPVREFQLSAIRVGSKGPFESLEDRSVEMVICTNGEATICDLKTGERLPMPKGRSIIVPAAVQKYRIEGSALLYKASVPLQRIGGQEAGKP